MSFLRGSNTNDAGTRQFCVVGLALGSLMGIHT